jgi:Right handed beta helix region
LRLASIITQTEMLFYKKENMKMSKCAIVVLLNLLFCSMANSQEVSNETHLNNIKIYVNSILGNDTNNGTKDSPLKTLTEAAKKVNVLNGIGTVSVLLSEGLYSLNETADFNPSNWTFSKETRLVIRAEILPNDTQWEPSKMPIIISAMPFNVEKNKNNEVTGGSNYGILIQTSHVTIQGLRILGEPVHELPKKGVLIRNYPIVWEGKDLSDLVISQCLFLGNKFALPNHLGILANGTELDVNHCVFYGIKDAVVMWNKKSENSKLHHNLFLNMYGAAVWTWSTSNDFSFYNNVASNVNVFWVLDQEEKESFEIKNSLLIGYNYFVNKGGGPQDFGTPSVANKLKFKKDFKVIKSGQLNVIEDQTSKYFLHIKQGTLGSEYGAGIFYKTENEKK